MGLIPSMDTVKRSISSIPPIHTSFWIPRRKVNGTENFFVIFESLPSREVVSDTTTSRPSPWNWTSGQFFAERPHGEITFTGARVPFIITNFGEDPENPTMTNITWNSVAGKIYGVDFSTNMKEWEELDDGVEGEAEQTTFSHDDAPKGKRGFYRVKLLE